MSKSVRAHYCESNCLIGQTHFNDKWKGTKNFYNKTSFLVQAWLGFDGDRLYLN